MLQGALHERIRSLDRRLGDSRLGLLLGRRRINLKGLDASLTDDLKKRWGGFVVAASDEPADLTARFFAAGPETWLDRWQPGESYRLEADEDGGHRLVASYHFGLERADEPSGWRVGICDDPEEPRPRIIENVIRFLTAHLALDDGGFAMHAAGLLRDNRAFLLAGPSRTGKTTASRSVAGAQSLGDDFGLVVCEESDWLSPALPFDNTERVVDRPCSGLYPLAGVWRLHQSDETRVERRSDLGASAALTACAAFAWAMPERADELLEHAQRLVTRGLFRDLYFSREADLWPHLESDSAAFPE